MHQPVRRMLALVSLLCSAGTFARAGEAEALAISAAIQARHMPFNTILDPVYSADNRFIEGYTRCGDSAIWTGHYIAAESYRYAVTRDPGALRNLYRAFHGLLLLVNVPGGRVLARCVLPEWSPYSAWPKDEEKQHGIYPAELAGYRYDWVGNTSRDQYLGIFFGLSVAYELVDDVAVRAVSADVARRLLEELLDNAWAVKMPSGAVSTTFLQRADQQLSLLIVGRQMNPNRFRSIYETTRFFNALGVGLPIAIDAADPHNSYFKFNLNALTLFHLVRLEGSGFYKDIYLGAYNTFRRTVDDHGNAHFNMIDRALRGPDAARDAATRQLLDQWLQRSRRDEFVDWRGVYQSCGQADRACDPIPVDRRVRTDFLWQRSPFLLYGGSAGRIEGAGIDYILPYWMARYYGVL